MNAQETKRLLEVCLARGEREKLYQIAKVIAESDSIGEGYGYCSKYTKSIFVKEMAQVRKGAKDGPYYVEAALEILNIK